MPASVRQLDPIPRHQGTWEKDQALGEKESFRLIHWGWESGSKNEGTT